MKILSIVAYGDAVLKKRATDIDPADTHLKELIADMFRTMYHAEGVGLAAPQVGLSVRLFVVDTEQLDDEKKSPPKGIRQAFINPTILEEHGTEWKYEEGCLSIPGVRGEVWRKPTLKIKYQDEDFNWKEEVFDGMNARVIQHEYDHIEGILFTDHLKPLKRKMISGKLQKISRGEVSVEYKMKFPAAR